LVDYLFVIYTYNNNNDILYSLPIIYLYDLFIYFIYYEIFFKKVSILQSSKPLHKPWSGPLRIITQKEWTTKNTIQTYKVQGNI